MSERICNTYTSALGSRWYPLRSTLRWLVQAFGGFKEDVVQLVRWIHTAVLAPRRPSNQIEFNFDRYFYQAEVIDVA